MFTTRLSTCYQRALIGADEEGNLKSYSELYVYPITSLLITFEEPSTGPGDATSDQLEVVREKPTVYEHVNFVSWHMVFYQGCVLN